MDSKKGQIALYIIIGVIIVSAVVIFFFFKNPISGEESQKIVSSQTQPIRDTVEKCFYFAARKTLNTMGRQGGYAFPKTDRISMPAGVMADAPALTFALMRENGAYSNYLPSVEEMKGEFIAFMLQNPDFEACLNDFTDFRKIMDISYGNLTIDQKNIDFGENSGEIVIPFKFPVQLKRGQATILIEDYTIKIPIDLAKIQSLAAAITNKISSGESYVALLQDFSLVQEKEVRKDPETDRMIVQSYHYDSLSLNAESKLKYHDNTLFRIEYQNRALDKSFKFYFLTGEK